MEKEKNIKREDENLFLFYEGEFLDGKRNGQGKEYNEDGLVCFEGEYANEKRIRGIKKSYYENKSIKLEEEYLNGKNNGIT